MRGLIPFTKGTVLLATGNLADAGAALAKGLRASDGRGDGYLRGRLPGAARNGRGDRGQLRKAAEFARRANATADRCGSEIQDRPAAADVALAWVRAEEYDLAAARVHCDRASTRNGLRTDPVALASLALTRARLHRARGDLAGAVAVVGRAQAAPAIALVPPWLLERLAVSATVWRGGSGTPDIAVTSITAAHRPQSPQCTLALASTRLAAGDVARGRRDGRQGSESLRLTSTEKLRRPVIEAAPRLRRFLRQDRELAERHAWLGGPVVGTIETPAAGARPATVAPIVAVLTDKEPKCCATSRLCAPRRRLPA